MTVNSQYIYYPSGVPGVGPAYDLRYCCTATRVGNEAQVRFVGMVNEIVVFPDWDDFFDWWDDILNPPPPGHEEYRVFDPTGTFHEDFNVLLPVGVGHEDFNVLEP
jgi:hypothetical protein